ncbi:MAG: hypothetical protein KDB23_33055 [Planctomycetales bacterium]|nr:hypothetical protein [Planctomycetales bacterium]
MPVVGWSTGQNLAFSARPARMKSDSCAIALQIVLVLVLVLVLAPPHDQIVTDAANIRITELLRLS